MDASDLLACTARRQAGRALALVAAITVASAFSLFLTPARADAKRVHIRGTAYEFNNSDLRLRGATIRVAEQPRLHATTKPDGSYDLAVPDHTSVTPYITAAGHHSIYLQTFRTAGEDLTRVNFQTPTEDVYRALAALLSVPLDPDGELRDCAIVSTFSTRNVRDLSFRGFTGYGAHGVAGATAFATPALPARSTSTRPSSRTRPSSAPRSTAACSGPVSPPAPTRFGRGIPQHGSRALSRPARPAAS